MAQTHDVLSDVLGGLSLRGEVFCRTTLGARTTLSFPTGQAHFHVVERGPCWVSVPEQGVHAVARSGDLLVLVGGTGHAVASAERTEVMRALSDVVPTHYDAVGRTLALDAGDAHVELVCGRFTMDPVGSEAVVGVLPPLVHLRAGGGEAGRWLSATLRLLSEEATSDLPGSELARTRLVDLVLIGALRRWLAEHGTGPSGWLSALGDPVVSVALGQLHQRPAHAWTVAELAASVGLSRSPFAARFAARVGMAPMKYLTVWRMRRAERLLRAGASVGEAADAVGYGSHAAFSRVFKRTVGRPPSAFRGTAS